MAVTEFVPEVAALERACVTALDQGLSRDRFKQLEMGGARLVPPGQKSIDRSRAPVC
jgi:hypothetical protein